MGDSERARRREDVRDGAACKGMDPNMFHPIYNEAHEIGGIAAEAARKALDVCDGCSVEYDCLATSVNVPADGGIRGGTLDAERRAMRVRWAPILASNR